MNLRGWPMSSCLLKVMFALRSYCKLHICFQIHSCLRHLLTKETRQPTLRGILLPFVLNAPPRSVAMGAAGITLVWASLAAGERSERGWTIRRRKTCDRWWEHGGDRTLALRLPGDTQPGQRRRRHQTGTASAGVRHFVNHDIYNWKIVSRERFPPQWQGDWWVCARMYMWGCFWWN